jgi:hypothetical protein
MYGTNNIKLTNSMVQENVQTIHNEMILRCGGVWCGTRAVDCKGDYWADIDRSDKLFYYYVQTENIRHFERVLELILSERAA